MYISYAKKLSYIQLKIVRKYSFLNKLIYIVLRFIKTSIPRCYANEERASRYLFKFLRTATRILFSVFFFCSFFLFRICVCVYVCSSSSKRWLKCSWPIIKRCIAQDRYYNHPLKLRNELDERRVSRSHR